MTFAPALNVINNYTLAFNNAIIPGSLSSTAFVDTNDTSYVNGQLYYFNDDSNGNIRTYKYVGPVLTYTNLNAGTINYATGLITLTTFRPASILDPSQYLDIIVSPQILDINPQFNQIIQILPEDINISMFINAPMGTPLG
jgi:hypothetical protein